MATLKSSKIDNQSPREVHAGVVTETAEYTGSASFSAGDVVQMVQVPKGAKVLEVTISGNQWTSGSADAAYIVGDGNDVDRYMTTASVSSVVIARMGAVTGHNYEYTADDTVDVTINAQGSSATTAPIIRLSVTYAVDQ